jgi:L-threonylcarbamoyladenylate synthase
MPTLDGHSAEAVAQAAQEIARGGLVGFATETVYGLGARADDEQAVARIFAAKGRPSDHPLIVHVADAAAVATFAAEVPPAARRLMAAFWPGPLTLILPRRAGVAAAAAGGQASIALRLPSHPVAQALLHEAARLGVPGVAAPSANRFGRVSPTRAEHVCDEFGSALVVLDGGPSEVGIESAIVDCTRAEPALLRPGQLGRGAIEAVLGRPLADPDALSPRASGTLASHYAPAAPVHLFDAVASRHPWDAGVTRPPGVGAVYSRVAPPAGSAWLHKAMPADAAAVAHELFAVLRDFDAAGASAIWVELPPPGGTWDGVRDRLLRAAA